MGTGERIRAARMGRGLTQKQLGELCGMADSAIRRYESGRGNPTEKTLQRIAAALLVRVSDLMDSAAYDLGFQEGSEAEERLNRQIDELWTQEGYTYSERECNLINAFSQLNDEGQGKVVNYAQDLIPRYRIQSVPTAPAESPEGKDTTPPPDAPKTPPEGGENK